MNGLDKFKRRLIRAVARRLIVEKMAEDTLWEDLRKETGCDCKLLWQRMRALTIKKLNRLLAADDCRDHIATVARLNFTDWLLFDLVLVHEKVDLITNPACEGDPKPLLELFSLVQRFQIEGLSGDDLAKAWTAAVEHYNNVSKSRHCSPMLLQRRWYQMKELARDRFYKFWFQYRGNSRLLIKAKELHQPTPLHIGIATKYPHVILEKFVNWEDAIRQRLVILPEEFSSAMRRHNLPKPCDSNDPDLVVVEPNIETIDLEEDSNGENNDDHRDTTDNLSNKLLVDIKTEPNESNIDGLSNVQIMQASHMEEPIEVDKVSRSKGYVENLYKSISMKVQQEESDIEKIDNRETFEDNQDSSKMPKIINAFGNAIIPQVFSVEEDQNISEEGNFVDSILQSTLQNIQASANPDVNQTSSDETTVPESNSDNKTIEDLVNDILKKTNDDLVKKSRSDRISIEDRNEPEISFETLGDPKLINVDIEFADYGVEFEDDDVHEKKENNDEQHIKANVIEELHETENEEVPKFDVKLLMDPVIYTTKLDHMNVFKDITYKYVSGMENFEKIIEESKPINKNAVIAIQEKDDTMDSSVKKIKMSSFLLQKPKSRCYHPIQLCKNPDFNTRLKWLTVSFLSSTRNRQLLNACKPMTIDVDKGFESKLINGILYLDTNTTISSGETIEIDDENQTTSVLPLMMPVQSLFDSTKADIKELVPPPPPELNKAADNNTIVSKGEVVNLPNKNLQHINQDLLIAEETPTKIDGKSERKTIAVNDVDNNKQGKKEKKKPQRCAISWGTKFLENIKLDDCLLTDTALGKMLFALDPNKVDIMSFNYDVDTKKAKKGISKIDNKGNAEENKQNVNTLQNIDLDNSVNVEPDNRPKKRNSRAKPKSRSIKIPNEHCCWAREKIFKTFSNDGSPKSALSVHKCSFPLCTCCCKLELATFYRLKKNNGNLLTPTKQLQKTTTYPSTEINKTSIYNSVNKEINVLKPINVTIDISDDDEEKEKSNDFTKLATDTSSMVDANRSSTEISMGSIPANETINDDSMLTLTAMSSNAENVTTYTTTNPIKKPVLPKTVNATKTPFNSQISTGNQSEIRTSSMLNTTSNLRLEQMGEKNVLFPNNSLNPRGINTKVSVSSNPTGLSHKISIDAAKRRIVVDGTLNEPVINDAPLKQTKYIVDPISKVIFLDSKSIAKTPTECPIFLGKNKILLTTVKLPGKCDTRKETNSNENNIVKPIDSQGLPNGVQLVLLPNGKLSYLIQPNVELTMEEKAALPAILSMAQQQISSVNIGDHVMPYTNFAENENIIDEVAQSHAKETQNDNINMCNQNISIECHEKKSLNETENSSDIITQNNFNPELSNILPNPETVEAKHANTNELSKQSKNSTQLENTGSSKKTILSDLMEMVGISPEDTKLPETQETTSTVSVPEIIPIGGGLKQSVSTLHELSPITSLIELRYACEQKGKFFKLDFVTGIIAPINVSIKKTMKPLDQKELSNSSSFIDLTKEDVKDNPTDNVTSDTVKCDITVRQSLLKPENTLSKPSGIKPLKLFRAVHPILMKKSKQNIVIKQLNKAGNDDKLKLLKSSRTFDACRRKQNLNKIEAKIDLVDPEGPFEEEYLVDTSSTEEDNRSQYTEEHLDQSDSSDDEPLAKKVKKVKQKDAETKQGKEIEHKKVVVNGTEYMVINSPLDEQQAAVPGLIEVPNSLPLENDNLSDSEMSQDDCILGF